MGRWFARHLALQGQQVVLFDHDEAGLSSAGQSLGVETATDLNVISAADALVFTVPIARFEEAVQTIAPFTRDGQIVIDITSVKTKPVALMHQYLPHCTVLGTHPVFGPGADGVHGQNVVLTPTDVGEEAVANRLERTLKDLGANVVQMTPVKHDELMAVVLGLTHYIAIIAGDAIFSYDNFAELAQVGGPTFRALLVFAESVLSEDPALYSAIQMHLPSLPAIEQGYIAKANEWAALVAEQDGLGFQARMSALKNRLAGLA